MTTFARATAWQLTLLLNFGWVDMNAIALSALQTAFDRACEWPLAMLQLEDANAKVPEVVLLCCFFSIVCSLIASSRIMD